MKSSKPYPVHDEVLSALRGKLDSGTGPADLVADMRVAGFDKIDSIKFIREFAGVSSAQAKAIVHLSPAWDDRYAADEAFHDNLEKNFELIMKEEETTAA